MQSDIIVTTPEKWDGVSRSWQTRNYVKAVSLIVIDEIHLLGEDRGPVLEVIVSRTNFIGASTQRNLRIIGLSTALANSRDLANWLRINKVGVYNFRSTVRPVPLEVHISGYPNRHYCPRMALMNKPTFQAIKTHSPDQPALVFVSSRRQTRLTALDLIAYLAAEDNPRQWVNMTDVEMDYHLENVRDQNLKLVLAFGIGLHHAGLQEKDRALVERLFLERKIQVLIATATLAWGVNLPAHLVVIKGTEYYDGKTNRYVDFPITDVLQMMGRAGRPQFDNKGVAVVLVHDVKKPFYMKFLNSPFPVESSLLSVLPDHLNAEIVAGTIQTKQQCLDYLTWTYFFRRLIKNPLSLASLQSSYCVQIGEDERTLEATVGGKIASYYYLHHTTLQMFRTRLSSHSSLHDLLLILCDAHEYAEFPVRHNEDITNREGVGCRDLAQSCPLPVNDSTYDSPHTKAFILLQAHFSRMSLPVTDYITDQKSVLDQAIRILQAIIDVCSDQGWLPTTLRAITVLQMLLQALWPHNNPLLSLPHIEDLTMFKAASRDGRTIHFDSLPELVKHMGRNYERLALMLRDYMEESHVEKIHRSLVQLPMVEVQLSLAGSWEGSLQEEIRPVPIRSSIEGPVRDRIVVHADQQYQLRVDLRRDSRPRPRGDTKALAPKFPKPKEEGWFLVLGQVENKELWALKRCPFLHKQATHELQFYTPPEVGNYDYTVYLMSDCYLGLDQQYDLHLSVVEPALSTHLTKEALLSGLANLPDDDSS
ncbi:ASCC3 [Cordylochernes scorpioides]|uniref:ASCC3 n=1 Tax=Cordylochernes scorpioides TaxID=51811 RepID=A0ABY6KGR8_9ARAC|nr:ASCC3 [Cordylochernes scorpioides]